MEVTKVLKEIHSKFIDKPFHYVRTVDSTVNIIDTRVPKTFDSHLPVLSCFSFISNNKVALETEESIKMFFDDVFSEYFVLQNHKPFISKTAKDLFEYVPPSRASEELKEEYGCDFESFERSTRDPDARCSLKEGFWQHTCPLKREKEPFLYLICQNHQTPESYNDVLGPIFDWCPLFHDAFDYGYEKNTLLYNINPESPLYHWVVMLVVNENGWRFLLMQYSLNGVCEFIEQMYQVEELMDDEMKRHMPYPLVATAAMVQKEFADYSSRYY